MHTPATVAHESADSPVLRLKRRLEALVPTAELTDDDAARIYALAYQEFNLTLYAQALERFQVLLVYRPLDTVYMLGAALCLQRLRRYGLAAAAFGALRFLEPANPGHRLAMAECQLLGHERDPARETLNEVIDYCATHPGHEAVSARAQAMLDLMRPHHESVAT